MLPSGKEKDFVILKKGAVPCDEEATTKKGNKKSVKRLNAKKLPQKKETRSLLRNVDIDYMQKY